MKIFNLANKRDREILGAELSILARFNSGDTELKKIMHWQIDYCRELVANRNGISDKVVIYGAADKFTERIEKPSAVQLSEIYDIENDVKSIKQQGYEIIGGLGGFSFNNGRYGGELIFLPGGSCMRVHIDHNKHTAMMVAPMNIYPFCVFTARKNIDNPLEGDNPFVVIFEKGDKITSAIEKLGSDTSDNKKTITGIINGSLSDMEGYIFSSASPKTVLTEFKLTEPKNMFLYQTLLGSDIPGFQRVVHTHGFEAAKFGEPHAFGGHLYNATVNSLAIGVFVVARKIDKY